MATECKQSTWEGAEMLNSDRKSTPWVSRLRQDREIVSLTTSPPQLDLDRMLRAHGYRQPDKAPTKVIAEAKRALSETEGCAHPQSFFRILPIDSLSGGRLALRDGPTLNCPAFSHYLKDCTEVCVFVTTLGNILDERIKSCMEETDFQPVEALFLGTFGWLMIEAVTRELIRDLKKDLSTNGQSLTLRMGPGYSYRRPDMSERVLWDLTDQAALLGAFKGIDLPVELTPGFSMKPSMTRSGIAGIKTPGKAGRSPIAVTDT